ncbi:unnamed protein product [Peniophora sp. CBMAI 1063]|nr:unnamed protein product [Peniophora sp. CBMAI 1063]
MASLNPASMPFFPAGATGRGGGGDEDGQHPGYGQHYSPTPPPMSSSPADQRARKPSPPSLSNSFTSASSDWRRSPALNGRSSTTSSSQSPPLEDTLTHLDSIPPHVRGAVGIKQNLNGSSSASFLGSSPVSSSLGSSSYIASSFDLGSQQIPTSLDAQLRASPVVRDILDRLTRQETANREIQSGLHELSHKVDILLNAGLGNMNGGGIEFQDPFAPAGQDTRLSVSPLNSGALPPSARPSIALPPRADDEISARLNTLTNSVGQLLALSQQQAISAGHLPPQVDIAPNQLAPPTQQGPLGHGLPNRPDLRHGSRTPNPPMRTWSAGSLDLPVRPDLNGMQPPMNRGGPDLLRDKRRSVSTNLMRRDSAGDLMNRDGSGPTIAKWEQLNLAPELLRSLTKFGVGPPNKIQQRALPFLLRGADIIAQAPPTQERIAAYVIPAIHVALVNGAGRPPVSGPIVVMVSTTVDQATQAQRMIRDLGGPIGVRSALGVGAATNDLSAEVRLLTQSMPHILCGTPQKLHAFFTAPGGLSGAHVRFLVLDEVDQLIARNLHDFIFNIVKLLPPPRSRPISAGTGSSPAVPGSGPASSQLSASLDALGAFSQGAGRRFSTSPIPPEASPQSNTGAIERQTALFSNTVPQDVLNLATAIQLREPVRVLVRRDGNGATPEAGGTARGLRQFYLYLAFTAFPTGRSGSNAAEQGLGIIGSGRGAGGGVESQQAREWKLDALCDLLDDVQATHAIVHVGGLAALDAVVYKLAAHGLEAVPLHGDMNSSAKLSALQRFRAGPVGIANSVLRAPAPPATRVLVVYDVQVKPPEVAHVPLVVNYDLPKAVEEYAHRVQAAVASGNASRPGVVVNFVTATGGDVEMLRSIECFYKIKCPEVPITLRDII